MMNPLPLILRPFQAMDLSACADIYMRSRRLAFHWLPAETFQPLDFIHDTQGEDIYVTEKDGHITGFVSFRRHSHFIHTLFVAPEYRWQGIGSALLALALEHFNHHAKLICVMGNLSARIFYEQKGGFPIAEGCDRLGPWIKYRFTPQRIAPQSLSRLR